MTINLQFHFNKVNVKQKRVKFNIFTSCKTVKKRVIGQFRYIEILTWFRDLGE